MIVWGGRSPRSSSPFEIPVQTGGVYDPVADTWSPTSTTGAPAPRVRHSAVWTGTRMIVWGGTDFGLNPTSFATGGLYDPQTDSWTPVGSPGAPAARQEHTAVWTGSRMIVWAGRDGSTYFDTGASYDPAADVWTSITTSNAPSARLRHTAVWTGSRMIVWGGYVAAPTEQV